MHWRVALRIPIYVKGGSDRDFLYMTHDHIHIHAFSDLGMSKIVLTNILLLASAHTLVKIWLFDRARSRMLFFTPVQQPSIIL